MSPSPLSPGRLRWQLRVISARHSTRQALDLIGLGPGVGTRVAAGLIVSAVFLLIALGVAMVERFPPSQGLPLAAAAFVIVFIPTAVLVLGPADSDLDQRREQLSANLEQANAAPPPLPKVQPAPAPRAAAPTLDRCPYCLELIQAAAVKCRHCGEYLDERLRRTTERQSVTVVQQAPPYPKWNPGVAAVLSFFIPGLGQLYKAQVFNGLAWFILVAIGYFFCVLPGVVLHLCCVIGAASGNPYRD